MKRFKLFLILSFITVNTFGVTAFPGKILFTQPNGDQVSIFLKGDEFIKYAHSEDGYTLLYDSAGFFNYAYLNHEGNLVPSVFHAKEVSNRTREEITFLNNLEKNLFFNQLQINSFQYIRSLFEDRLESMPKNSTKGSLRLLCVLIGFQDKSFVKTNADFQNLLNQIGYNYGGASGSVHDFYAEASYNQLNVIFDVVGPFTAMGDMADYGSNTYGDPSALAYEAIQFADPLVDFSDYDNDNNGSVDGLYIIFAGTGEEAGAGADAIWSHAGWVSAYMDNVQINGYACSPEHRGSGGTSITNIGVICHELGHVLGAPDYYDTNYETGGSYEGTGSWDLMASGSWNNSGRTPAHPNPRIKIYTYNWADVQIISTPQTVLIPPSVSYSNAFYRVNTNTNNEYFLIENKVLSQFDIGNPGNGMMIYRCASNIGSGSINTTHRQKFYPVAANATLALPVANNYGTIDAPSCPWPGTLSKTSFTDNTTPSMKSWSNVNTVKPITNIAVNPLNSIVSFDFMGGGALLSYPVFIPAHAGAQITPENGSSSPVPAGGTFSFSVTISPNFSNSTLFVRVGNDTLIPVNNVYTISNIHSSITIELLNLSLNKYPIIAYQNENGTISPTGITMVNHGASYTYSITPSVGYSIQSVYADSILVGSSNTYTFTNVTDTHTIYAHFQIGSPDIIQSSSNYLNFISSQNVPSAHQTTLISADVSQLTINLLIKAPQHFQVSLNGTTWVSQLVIQKSNLPQDLYVRFLPSIVGTVQDTIKIASTGALTYLFVTGESTVSVHDYSLKNDDIHVFPNPTKQYFTIQLDQYWNQNQYIDMYIFDIYAHQLMHAKLESTETTFDVESLVPGLYFIILSDQKNKIMKKLVIQ